MTKRKSESQRINTRNCEQQLLKEMCNMKPLFLSCHSSFLNYLAFKWVNIRFAFTGNWVGIVIRSADQYDLLKIKPTESLVYWWSQKQILKKRKYENDYSSHDSIKLTTLHTTLIFNFLRVLSTLTTATATSNPSLLKTVWWWTVYSYSPWKILHLSAHLMKGII